MISITSSNTRRTSDEIHQHHQFLSLNGHQLSRKGIKLTPMLQYPLSTAPLMAFVPLGWTLHKSRTDNVRAKNPHGYGKCTRKITDLPEWFQHVVSFTYKFHCRSPCWCSLDKDWKQALLAKSEPVMSEPFSRIIAGISPDLRCFLKDLRVPEMRRCFSQSYHCYWLPWCPVGPTPLVSNVHVPTIEEPAAVICHAAHMPPTKLKDLTVECATVLSGPIEKPSPNQEDVKVSK